MAAFQDVVGEAARRFAAIPDVGAWIHEAHHSGKRDAPSGTALSLKDAIARAGYDRPVDVSSTRAGSIPGTHTVGFDGPSETVTLTHVVRDRRVFAHGAIEAAKWLKGRTGWYTMKEMIVNLKSR
jgi:4-hydroxy-tetrahydrodipicolinate reductase